MTKQKTVLITRPRVDAGAMAEKLTAQGWRVLLAPMMTVENLSGVRVDFAGVQAVLITSANGVRALAKATTVRDIKLVTVGESSAETARDLGFSWVDVADPALGGDAAGLTEYVGRHYQPDAGVLLHICGRHVAGNLKNMLGEKDFSVTTAELYEARATDDLPEEATKALQAGEAGHILFYSPRTAKLFLQRAAGFDFSGVVAVALSRKVAQVLAGGGFAGVKTAASPTGDALLALLAEAG